MDTYTEDMASARMLSLALCVTALEVAAVLVWWLA